MLKIEGRYSKTNRQGDRVERTFTAEEATELLKNGHRGFLSCNEYEIEGFGYIASGLSLGDDTFIYERDGKFVVPTWFPRNTLVTHRREGDPEERVFVDVIVKPDQDLYLTIVERNS